MKSILMKILHKHTPKNTQKLKKTETVFAAQKLEYIFGLQNTTTIQDESLEKCFFLIAPN